MNTPIYDFLQKYAHASPLRLHMPGHKGHTKLGLEALDLTEVSGADSLYEAAGIIKESEDNATSLFGCPTYYSTEGSSLCIRAMLYLAMLQNPTPVGSKPLVLACRNAHKTFLSALSLLDIEVAWLYAPSGSYLSCVLTPQEVESHILASPRKPMAVYVTSPDYLGNVADIAGMAQVCHKHGVLLLVDNAHGAYLKFLTPSRHPMDLGADLCCDSAHKTLPVLTGGAYLHVSESLDIPAPTVKSAMALFGSTSPSYLILASLDLANAYLAEGYDTTLSSYIPTVEDLKNTLCHQGFCLVGNEPLKLTIATKSHGYLGEELASLLFDGGIVCEFADPDFVVFMLTPEVSLQELDTLKNALLSIPSSPAITIQPPHREHPAQAVLSPREALFSPTEILPVHLARGRILGTATVGCPPAVPIVVSGEVIDEAALQAFDYYGITTCVVVKET